MKERTKKLAGLMLAGAVSLSAAACNGVSLESGSRAGEGETVKILLSEEPGSEDALHNMLLKWAEESEYQIEVMIISNDDQLTKFPAMAKNKDLPDLIVTTRLHQLYADEFMDISEILDISIIEDKALSIIGTDYSSDKVTGFPFQLTTTNLYYNGDAFEAAGIQAPGIEDPWTWNELYEKAAVLKESGAVKYGFAADVSRARYDILMYANGGAIVTAADNDFQVVVNSPENVATLEQFIRANDEGIMPKAIWAGGTTDNPVEYFRNGDVGILLSGSWNYNSFASELTGFRFAVMPTPMGSASHGAIIGGTALAIPQNARHKEAAAQFIKWLAAAEQYTEWLQMEKGLSAINGLVYEPEGAAAAKDFGVIQNEVTYVTDSFLIDESSSWRTYKDNEYRDSLKRAVSGEISAKAALDIFAKELSESSGWRLGY